MPLTQPKKKARWEQEAAEATGGPRQQDPRPPWDCRHHSKVTVADPSPPPGRRAGTCYCLGQDTKALPVTQNSSSEPEAGPPEGRAEAKGKTPRLPGASGVQTVSSLPSLHPWSLLYPQLSTKHCTTEPCPWMNRHQHHCPLGTRPQTDIRRSQGGDPPSVRGLRIWTISSREQPTHGKLASEAKREDSRTPRWVQNEQ